MAITDHGVMYGVIDFLPCGKSSRNQTGFSGARSMLHRDLDLIKRLSEAVMTVTTIWYFWQKNDIGYHNLMKIVSRGFTEGYYYKRG